MSTTTVVSARVDTATLRCAMRAIDASNTSIADVIKRTIYDIARTGKVDVIERVEAMERARREEGHRKMEEFIAFTDSVEWAPWLATLTDEQMKDMIASKYD